MIRTKTNVVFLIALLLSLVPPLLLSLILFSTGAENPSSDSINYFMVIDRILSGTYAWKHFFYDTFVPMSSGHCGVFPVLMNLLSAYFFHWNIYSVISFGLILGAIKTALFFDALTCRLKSPYRWLLLPVISCLVFSYSQISIFEFELTSMQYGLYQTGLALGIWGLVRFPRSWRGVCLAGAGGLIASWSYGAGPLCWPVFFLGMLLLGFRKVSHFAVFFAFSIAGAFPYLYFLILNPQQGPYPTEHFYNFSIILPSLGWPLVNNFELAQAVRRGVIGWILLIAGLVIFLITHGRKALPQAAPGLMLLLFFFLHLLQLAVFRAELHYWYAGSFILPWIALAGFAFIAFNELTEKQAADAGTRGYSRIATVWGIGFFYILGFFFLSSNLSYRDKSFFLEARSPVAASCLRSYANAPTLCHEMVVRFPAHQKMWELGESLRQRGLGIFSPKQNWSLQGDFILEGVRVVEDSSAPDIIWTDHGGKKQIPFTDYQHLNLFLHSPNKIEWNISLPSGIKNAIFESAVTISPAAPLRSLSDGLVFEISIKENGISEKVFSQYLLPNQRDWLPVKIDLTAYAGKNIDIILASNPLANVIDDWGVWRYPQINFEMDSPPLPTQARNIHPENTDLHENFPNVSPVDLLFAARQIDSWSYHDMQPAGENLWITNRDSYLEKTIPNGLALKGLTHFFIKLGAPPTPRWDYKFPSPPLVQVFLKLRGETQFRHFNLPLLDDSKTHAYVFDLKLLELPNQAILEVLRVDPAFEQENGNNSWVSIEEIGFLKRTSANVPVVSSVE